ncbi:MAG TPA: AMP-binding protein [Methylomirabilota bacterium]|nr:AMP-binding protein [Methylomirabilota bacterium]
MDGRARHLTEPIEAFRDIDSLLTGHARTHGARGYVECLAPPGGLTFAELDAATNRVAHFLADRGLRPNDRVSVLSDNCLELLVLFLGVQRYGATVNPINVEVHARNVAQILHDVEPRLTFWSPALPAELQALARAAGETALPFDELWAQLAALPATPGSRRVGGPRDIAILDYTSGTTATPKGVLISHQAVFYQARSLVERLGLTEDDRLLEYRALSWASPQVLSVGPSLQAGAGLVLAPRFSRRRFFDWIREYGVTVAAGVPTVFAVLLAEPVAVTAADLPSLRFMTSSSAPLPVETQLAFERRYGIPIVQGCGMTEAGFMGGNPPGARRLSSIGPAMPYIEARFVDESGAVCPPGREGELVVTGRQLAAGYLVERGRVMALPGDGLRTGDLGYADAEGYLYLTGRTKDVIIKGGVNVAPMEITSVLLGHPAVADAATIGVPDPVYGEAIVSFVVPRPGEVVTTDELRAHCATRLSEFKQPQQIRLVDALPRTDRGKLARERLQALAEG